MATKSPDDIKQSDEWQKAVDYAITDHDIERQEKLLGYMQAAKTREYIQTATTDNIRNFAHGTGDDELFPLGAFRLGSHANRWCY